MTNRRLVLVTVAAAALFGVAACSNSPSRDTQDADPAGNADTATASADCSGSAPAPSVGSGGGTITKPCASSTSATEAVDQVPDGFIGSWRSAGSVTQTPPTDPYTMTLTLRAGTVDEVVGSVSYPELGCSGELTLVEAGPDTVTVTEEITDDPQFRCIVEGSIELTATDAGLDYAYTAASDPSATAFAALVPA